ncbi:mechanosensitive ion channel protein 10-like [Hibiscus syriacus]|uniref:mechanosensitive ion channel protein 10-like n=1 Tax=Hibiscus syriacus TaxID=106335 RepID=UPI001923CF5E|nr:mechanosensitive ion channel protein 10-like [Hibiscus syriacus]
MAEKRSSGEEVMINVHSESEENLKGLKGSPPNEIDALDPQQNTQASPAADKPPTVATKKVKRRYKRKLKKRVMIDWVIFLLLLGCLIASLTVDKLHNTRFWDLETWKWCVLVMVTFCGMLVTGWFVRLVVFLSNVLLRKRVMYFVHGLKKSVQVFIWLSSVLGTWVLLFLDVERSKTVTKILDYVTWALVSILIGAFLLLLKTLLLMMFTSSFHKNNFFERIQESVFHQYIIRTLSGPPLMENAEETERLIDTGKLHRLTQENVSYWHMKVLVDDITNSRLTIISNALDESSCDEDGEQEDKEITNEKEARSCAHKIFINVAPPPNDHNSYFDKDDLLRFMTKEEVDIVFPLFEGSNNGKIDGNVFTNWVTNVFRERRALALTLFDTKKALEQLNKLVSAILIVVTFIIWLLLVGTATTRVLLVIAAFLFGETCKTIFQVVVFVFVMHPFDVGDRCAVDGVKFVVEEINILTTTFLKGNNEKVYYPNSVLYSKPISNYYRSPDMGDSIEFCIDLRTPAETIGTLKKEIKRHLEANGTRWHPQHLVVVTEIENDNKLKMALHCCHTMNFQDLAERIERRSNLIDELRRILEGLSIRYSILPEKGSRNQVTQDRPEATNAMFEE